MKRSDFEKMLEDIAVNEAAHFVDEVRADNIGVLSQAETLCYLYLKSIEGSARMTAQILEATGLLSFV